MKCKEHTDFHNHNCEDCGAEIRDHDSKSHSVVGYALNREYGKTPNGNNLNGKWVLRLDGKFIDFDKYKNDLIERHNIKL